MKEKAKHEKLNKLKEFIVGEMPITDNLDFTIDQFNEKGLILSAPLRPNINHRGTVFGGSLCMLAILAGYGMALLLLDNFDIRHHIVIQKEDIIFNKPVRKDFNVVCPIPAQEDLDKFKQMFLKKGKGRIYLHCNIREKGSDINAALFNGAFVAIS